MTEKGYQVTFHADGGRSFAGAGSLGQEGLLELLDECTREVGGEPATLPVTEEEKGKLYDLELESYECLRGHGYEPDPPPTREHYVATFDLGPPWFAHASSSGVPIPESDCPSPKLTDITW